MNRCKNCRWWKNIPLYKPGTGEPSEFEFEAGICEATNCNQRLVLHKVGYPRSSMSDAAFPDANVPYGQVRRYTGPDFGCVHWQEESAEVE